MKEVLLIVLLVIVIQLLWAKFISKRPRGNARYIRRNNR